MKKLGFCLLLLLVARAQASVISDFSWIGPGAQYSAGTVLADGTQVTLSTTPIPFDDFQPGWARIFSASDGRDAVVTLSFDRVIRDLRLWVDDLDTSVPEFLDGFSTLPSAVDGDLVLNPGSVTSTRENGGGNLFWYGLNASTLSFVFHRDRQTGLFLRQLEIDSATPVPLPATVWLLLAGALAWRALSRRGA